jgi:hypothetical protein
MVGDGNFLMDKGHVKGGQVREFLFFWWVGNGHPEGQPVWEIFMCG